MMTKDYDNDYKEWKNTPLETVRIVYQVYKSKHQVVYITHVNMLTELNPTFLSPHNHFYHFHPLFQYRSNIGTLDVDNIDVIVYTISFNEDEYTFFKNCCHQ